MGRYVHGVLLECLERNDLEGALVGGRQHDEGGGAVAVGPQPVDRGHAPAIAGNEPGEVVLGDRRGEVVADAALVLEEFGGDHGADGVAAPILGSGRAAPVPVEARQRVGAARLQRAAQHISISHPCSIADRGDLSAGGGQGTGRRESVVVLQRQPVAGARLGQGDLETVDHVDLLHGVNVAPADPGPLGPGPRLGLLQVLGHHHHHLVSLAHPAVG